jgi:hypothetical protein
MAKAKPLPRELAVRSFTIGEARYHGLAAGRAKAKDLHVPSRGIRVPTTREQSLLARARPYTQPGPPLDCVSFYSAAVIHRFKLPGTLPETSRPAAEQLLHLTRRGSAAPRRKGIAGHRSWLAPADVVVLEGVPVTSIPRTLPDLAGTGSLGCDDMVVIVDDLVCEHTRDQYPKVARIRLDELLLYAERQRSASGLPLLRKALGLARVGIDSPPESRLRLLFGRSDLPVFEPNFVLVDSMGSPLWIDLGRRCGLKAGRGNRPGAGGRSGRIGVVDSA